MHLKNPISELKYLILLSLLRKKQCFSEGWRLPELKIHYLLSIIAKPETMKETFGMFALKKKNLYNSHHKFC